MDLIINSTLSKIIIYSIISLYIILLLLMIKYEVNNFNNRWLLLAWIIGSLIFPIVPFIYFIVVFIKFNKARKINN